MNGKYKNPFEGMQWFETQKQFMDAFATLNQGNNPFTSAFSSQQQPGWADAMDSWWRAFKPAGNAQQENVFMKMLDQARQYYFISEQFSKMYDAMSSANKNNQDALAVLNKAFEDVAAFIEQNTTQFSWSHLIDQCEQPLELLKNTFAQTQMFAGQPFNDFSPEVQKLREKFLTMPGLGYSRESQEKLQKALHLWANYQDNYQEFQTVMSKLSHEALDLMRKDLIRMHKKGEQVESMRQIYNIWVASNEKVYGDFVFTEEYSELNARLVNSLMAFKKESQGIMEDNLASMNLPTTKSINALEKRQHELRKQIRQMETQLKQLHQEVKTLRDKPLSKTTTSRNNTGASAKAKPRKKTQKKKSVAATSSSVVDFKKSKRAKQKKRETAEKKQPVKDNNDGMIELKF